MPDRRQLQLRVSDRELGRMRDHIYRDFMAARSNHDRRIERFRRMYRMWRGLSNKSTKEDGAQFELPMLKWFTFGHWARSMQSLLGDDAEIVAIPTAPTDAKISTMTGHYMTWRFFEYMKATNPLTVWMFRTILFGVGHAEILYEQDYYWERTGKGPESDKERICYDGPRLSALWPSQIVTPAQDDVSCADQFDWIVRRRRLTPQRMLDGERRGHYFGIRENWNTITAFAHSRQERDYWWDDEKIDADYAEGVDHTTVMGNRDSLDCWEWYGKWRMPKGKQDAALDNFDRRDANESELLIKYLPQADLIIGVQDRRDLYPRMRKRMPFVDCHLVRDGSYWNPGLGELLEDIQREGTINHNLFRRAGMLSVGPVIFYRPGSGYDPDTFEYKPHTAIPTEDPQSVNVVRMQADLQYPLQMAQVLKGVGELVVGVSDTTNGQSIDRPNAPRTAAGQAMLIQEGNVRASLDMTMLREDNSNALGFIWELDREFSDDEVYFRVTGDDASGLYDVDQGFGRMTSEEREHEFAFELKFATSIWSREAKKQAVMALYQISVSNPIIAQNPFALWHLLKKVWTAFGESNFEEILPEPPKPDVPKDPKQEWELCLQGDTDDLHVSPLDDDMQHMVDHRKRLVQALQEPEERRDPRAIAMITAHIIEHENQRRQKMLLQAAMQQAAERFQQQQNGGVAPGAPQPPGFTGPPPQPFPGGQPGPGNEVQAAADLAGPHGVGGA